MPMTTTRAPLACTTKPSARCSDTIAELDPIITTFPLPVASLVTFQLSLPAAAVFRELVVARAASSAALYVVSATGWARGAGFWWTAVVHRVCGE